MHCIHMFQIIIFVGFVPLFLFVFNGNFSCKQKVKFIMCNESGSNDACEWTCEPTQLKRKEFLKIFHAMSWNIFVIFIFHMANFMWCGGIFLGSTIVYWLWTWVWPTKLPSATSCEGLKTKKRDAFHHPWCKQYSKCLGFLDKNYDVFKTIEMGGNCMVEKYLMKLKPWDL
jgi:hypothetical protein